MKVRTSVLAGSVAAAALFLGACSSSEDHGRMTDGTASMEGSSSGAPPIPADAPFNSTDVGFAQGMIPHHAQAVEMADMALEESGSTQVRELATAIKAAQQPEIDQLTSWLEDWDQEVPDTDMDADHDMSGMDGMMMSGMMSAADMERLGDATGAEFDRLWLEMMIQHHNGAISMADDELAGGEFEATKMMAQSITTSQAAEIQTMEGLLGS